MGLLEALGKLLGHAAGPVPFDCEDPAYAAEPPPGLEEFFSRSSRGMLGDLRSAAGPADGPSRLGA